MKRKLLSLLIVSLFASGAYAQATAKNQEAKETSTVLTAGGVTQAWARGITGKGATIAIIDQGFDLTHADFAGKIVASKNFYPGLSGVTWGEHGTMMAGIAAGAKNDLGTVGVAPDAKLIFAQIGAGGTSTGINKAAMYQAIDWASAQGATVINLSLGTAFDTTFQKGVKSIGAGIYQAPTAYGSMYGLTKTDLQAYAVGTGRGSIIVAASGNQGLPYAQFPGAFATQVDANGNLVLGGRMLIVGATDPTGQKMASFSNAAGSICSNIVNGVCKDPYLVKDFYVVAPGMQVYGSSPNQLNLGKDGSIAVSGTSPATAYVSGGVALMKQAWPQLRPEQLVSIILNTAKPLGDSNVYGRGMVDFNAATQPMGSLQLANNTKLTGSGPTGKFVPVSTTGVVSSGATSFVTNSTLLKSIQTVDSMGRNYAVDMSKAVGFNNPMSYQFGSPWMALSPSNYKQITNPIGKDATLTIMASDQGAASQYEWQYSPSTRLMIEAGVLNERNGFLGTQGSGAFAFGGSNTSWTGLGFKQQLVGETHLIGNYTIGITRVGNMADSIAQVGSNVVSDSWKVGIAQDKIFFKENKTKDTLSFAVAAPVAVRSGHATVSGVTGYTYSENGDGTTTANPIMASERVSLAPQVREIDLVLGYAVNVKNNTSVGFNIVRQFNVAGQPGVQANGGSIMVRSVF